MIKRLITAALLCVFMSAWMQQAVAKDKQPVPSLDIKVMVKAEKGDAKSAKEAAIVDGLRQAFYQALLQLAPAQARDVYRKLRGADYMRYVQSYTIDKEVAKAGSYEAQILFRFDRAKLQDAIGIDTGLADSLEDPEGEGLLIIPAYRVGDQMLVFEQGNQWRLILNNIALEVGQGALVMPFGDVRDQQTVTLEALLAKDKESFKKMARRYGTRNVVIATATSEVQGEQMVAQVRLSRIGGKKEDDTILQVKENTATQTLEGLLAKIAQATAVKLQATIQDYSLFGMSEKNKVHAIVLRAEFEHGFQWRYMHERLQNVPNLVKLDVGAVGVDFAQATIFHRGNPSIVTHYLQQQGLIINDSTYKYWVVHVPVSIAR
jgi:hypothetical protein